MIKKAAVIILMLFLVGCASNYNIVTNKVKEDNTTMIMKEKKPKTIKELLDEILKSQNSREYYVYIENLDNGDTYIWGDESYQASALGTVFIPIMIAADKHLGWIDEFDRYNDEVECLIKDMIRYSDSSAANRLIDLLGGKEKGLSKINNLLTKIGCSNTSVNRYLGDTSSVKDNYTTSSDMAVMLKYIYNKNNRMFGTLMSATEASDAIKKTMHKHEDFKSASEYGSAASGYRESKKSIYNNSGIIISNDSEKNYLISVISLGDDDISDSFNIVRKIVSTLIEKNIDLSEEEITFKDKNLEKFIRKEINKPIGAIFISDVEMIAKQLSFKNFEFPSEVKSIIERYKNDCAKKNIVVFEDENLEEVIRYEINNLSGDILKNQVEKITELQAGTKNIKSISGLENLTNLTRLFLYENQISNVEPLRELTKLTHLDIEMNNITSIESLSGLINLDTLHINKNGIDDFTPVKSYFKNLECFSYDVVNRSLLEEKESADRNLEPIWDVIGSKFTYWNMPSRRSLDTITEVTNEDVDSKRTLEGFQLLQNLTRISLTGQAIKDLTPLKNLTNLTQIDLEDNCINSIEPLKDLPNLKYLNLNGNSIIDVETLKDFKSLPEIHLDDNPISDRGPLDEYYKKFNKNKVVDDESYQKDDEKIIFKDPNFEKKIREYIHKPTGDILKEDVKYIFSINAEYCEINNISGIENLTNLTHLYLKNNKISNLEPLRELTGLVNLDLSYNQIENIDALKELTKLISLNLYANEITNIEPVRNMNNLVKLQLEFNQIEDYELLEECSKKIAEVYYDKIHKTFTKKR